MVNARLHIICGNCGCSDMFHYRIIQEEYAEEQVKDVYITCRNCGTLHALSSYIPEQPEASDD